MIRAIQIVNDESTSDQKNASEWVIVARRPEDLTAIAEDDPFGESHCDCRSAHFDGRLFERAGYALAVSRRSAGPLDAMIAASTYAHRSASKTLSRAIARH
jgi:hypothetical protein